MKGTRKWSTSPFPSTELKQFLDGIQKELNFRRLEDWYTLEPKKIPDSSQRLLFQTFLASFDGSPSKLLFSCYPSHEWFDWKFHYFGISGNSKRKSFMDWLGAQLGLKSLNDWYTISIKDIEDKGGKQFLDKYKGSLHSLMDKFYPIILF